MGRTNANYSSISYRFATASDHSSHDNAETSQAGSASHTVSFRTFPLSLETPRVRRGVALSKSPAQVPSPFLKFRTMPPAFASPTGLPGLSGVKDGRTRNGVCGRRQQRQQRQATAAKMETGGNEANEKKGMDIGALAAAVVVSLSTILPVLPVLPTSAAQAPTDNGNWTAAREKPMHQASFEVPYGAKLEARWERRSVGSSRETYVLVSNASRRALDLMWINYIGEEEHYATIPTGTSLLQQSYATHPWVVRDHVNQSMVAVLSADLEVTVAVIGLEEESGIFDRADEALSMIQRVKMSNNNSSASNNAGIRFNIESF